ncbi:U3 small nucleolar RNA-associated protein 6-domain-containing protein [Calycina marina]|uniref:U3 small nucleolar RNA-associated protein 6-domain-containing protein n=1 Tax=Calycina marina TaxID=1763456 RepID=A0A9P7Z096_9HELO|nr:U3 small nucleolar RNA-associated protein 6-domain-containing protein [Calycina marina]
MAGVSDKARFYLERSVPQLQEFAEKKIFAAAEIKSFVKKRSEFEHKVLARGSTPIDFAQYAAWETNLERLRQKRCSRLRIKSDSRYAGPARTFQIYDRGTQKHPGDVGLWMSYLEFARKEKGTKKWEAALTQALRLHPTKEDFWLYAARWSLERDGDMAAARSYMQRGTRFCTRNARLWIEYAKMEMIYLAKIALRRKILGLDPVEEEVAEEEVEEEDGFATSQDVISLKTHTLRSEMVAKVQVDGEAKKDPMDTPALNGAIPMAIYDSATKQSFFCTAVAEQFFDMFALFTQVRSLSRILQHVLDSMRDMYAKDASTFSCYTRWPVVTLDVTSSEFPMALATSLSRAKEARESVSVRDRAALAKKTRAWVEPILAREDIDPGVRTVLEVMLQRIE